MDAKGTLERLLRIQELALAVTEAQKIVESAPGRVEEIEARFRERNAEYVAVRERFDALELDEKTRTERLAELEEQKKKYMADLMGVKNQREYATMLREIDAVKAEISGHDEAILKDMEALESLKGELASHEEHIKKEREQVAQERGAVESEAGSAQTKMDQLLAERESIESELPGKLRSTIANLEPRRQGIFLTKADNGTCLSCFVRVRPQAFQEVKGATAVHTCSNCRRFLYYEPSLRAAEAAPADAGGDGGAAEVADTAQASQSDEPKAENIPAANGGAV